jgi:hypothetical protein
MFEFQPKTLSLEIFVPAIKDETNWTWRCEGKQHFVYINGRHSYGMHEAPEFQMRPRAIKSSGICIVRSVKHHGVDQILGGFGIPMSSRSELWVEWPMFTKDDPLEIEFILTSDASVFSMYLEPAVLADRFREDDR